MNPESKHNLREVLKPVGRAKGLPNQHYVDQTVFKNEKNSLFFNNWAGIGFEKDVPKSGDAYPLYFMDIPILIVRDHNSKIRTFQNTCRHRGMILFEKKETLRGIIRCPYHSWCYELNGALRSTPHVGGAGHNIHPDIKKSELSLHEFACFVWHGVIFINISGTAKRFKEVYKSLLFRWKDFQRPLFHSGDDSSIEFSLNANWKLAVENYCESYHLPWIHPGLNSYSKLEDHYNIEQAGLFSGQGSSFYRQLKDKNGKVFKDFRDLSEKWETGAEYISVFPNVLLGVHRDHTIAAVLLPKSPLKTLERIEIHYASKDSIDKGFSRLRKLNRSQWENIFEEDIFVVEGMQKGRNGILFDGGRFSPIMDSPTHIFHKWVANNYEQP